MSIKYTLIPNHLTDDPDAYMAVIQNQTTRTIDDIIDEMADDDSTFTREDILSMHEKFKQTVKKFLAKGDCIKTDLFYINRSIVGKFNDVDDHFDRTRHHVRHHMSPGPDIGAVSADVPVEKVTATLVRPVPVYFRDLVSGTQNEMLTPGGTAEIRGSHLKFDTEDPEQGIWFIPADDRSDTDTKVELVIRSTPAGLVFDVPDALPPGEYSVEVRVRPQNSPDLRTGRLNAVLVAS